MIPKLYTISQVVFGFAMRLVAFFNLKAKKWVLGRKYVFEYLEKHLDVHDQVIWVHTPSLGEFEQGLPLIDQIKKEWPKYKILLTFYSPSGYEVRKNDPRIDVVCYLPIDLPKNAIKFVKLIQPKYTFFIKYDFWPHYLNELQKGGFSHYFISSIFRKDQYFFKFYGTWMLSFLSKIDHIFVQDQESMTLLNANDIHQVSIVGDTRIDQVIHSSKSSKTLSLIQAFKGNSKLFLAGSTWPVDTSILIEYIRYFSDTFKYVFAPHEISDSDINNLQSFISGNVLRYSECNLENIVTADVLIIDNIGLLSTLYKYADFSYIGGGFGKGIHNILEAAIFGIPIFIGPNNNKFKEAIELKKLDVAIEIYSKNDMIKETERLINDSNLLNILRFKSRNYVINNSGATKKILNYVAKKNL